MNSSTLQRHSTNIFEINKSLEIHGLEGRKSAIFGSSKHFLLAILLFQFYTLFWFLTQLVFGSSKPSEVVCGTIPYTNFSHRLQW